MPANVASLIGLLTRPQAITVEEGQFWADKIQEFDGRAFGRGVSTTNFMQRVASMLSHRAADDDERAAPITKPAAYSPLWLGEAEAAGEYGWCLHNKVAVLRIDSPLVEAGFGMCGMWFHGYDTILAAIKEARADARVNAVMLSWASPGGVVCGSLYELVDYLQATAGPDQKPIWSYCDLCASAAYWVGAQTPRMIGAPAGYVGSIGIVTTHYSLRAADERAGVKVTAIQFGARKTDGADFKDLEPAAIANLQADVNDLGEDFVADVGIGRGARFTADQARATQATVYPTDSRDPARSGLKLGLIDAVMPEAQAFAELVQLAAAPPPPIPATAPAAAVKPPASAVAQPAAPAAQAPTAASAAHAKEKPMTSKEKNAAIAAVNQNTALTDADKLKQIADIIAQPSDDAADPNTPAEEAAPAADAPAATAPKPKPAVDAVEAAQAVSQQILDLPEAKGREALARKLAFQKGMTVAIAKDLLASAPAAVQTFTAVDPKLSATGGEVLSDEDREHAASFANAGVRMRKRA